MKKTIIVLIALTTTLVSMTVVADLYTKSQINSFIEKSTSNWRYRPYIYQRVDGNYVKDDDGNYFYRKGLVSPYNFFSISNACFCKPF